MTLKFYSSVAKGLKLKFRMFLVLIPRFVEVAGEKLVGGVFLAPPSWLNYIQKDVFLKEIEKNGFLEHIT